MANSKPNDPNTQTGIDMKKARAQSTIDVESVRDFLHGSRSQWNKKAHMQEIISNDPVFDKSKREYMTRSEKYRRGMLMTKRLYELKQRFNWTQQELLLAFALLDDSLPLALHLIAFTPVFASQSKPPLSDSLLPLTENLGIFGAYLQTELAHGSNVAKLETTATYLPKSKEFEIHSPSITSAKWWIGALGRTATHGVVQAKLLLPMSSGEPRDMGPHLFLVQLRSLNDHRPLPGIILGDIGPKSMGGSAANDNGYALFDHVRIPKTNMLDKFSRVTDEGEYVKPPHAKISYGGMLYIRSNMVTTAGWNTARSVTISLRYTHVRRQGSPDPSSPSLENQVINYPAVYYRLLPVLARAYVWIILGPKLSKSFDEMNAKLATGDTTLLAEMHATTSGLKSLVTAQTITDIETSRRAMGGHGYSAYSGVGRVYADYLPAATFEGDNYVLDQQVVRASLKALSLLSALNLDNLSSLSLSPSTQYLRLLLLTSSSSPPQLLKSPEEWSSLSSLSTLVLLLEWRAALIVKEYASTFSAQGEEGIDASASQRLSKAVTEAFVAVRVAEVIKGVSFAGSTGNAVKDLYLLYLLTTVEGGVADLLSFGLIKSSGKSDPTLPLRQSLKHVCLRLLPEAIGLSDAFGFSDWDLDSALGVYDGKVYEALWKRVKEEPMNSEGEVTPAYEESIKAMLTRGREKAKL